jgi:hypothetical protein
MCYQCHQLICHGEAMFLISNAVQVINIQTFFNPLSTVLKIQLTIAKLHVAYFAL